MVKFNRDVREPRPVEIAGVKRISSSEVICLLWLLYWGQRLDDGTRGYKCDDPREVSCLAAAPTCLTLPPHACGAGRRLDRKDPRWVRLRVGPDSAGFALLPPQILRAAVAAWLVVG